MSQNKQTLNFSKLINEYKQENFKKMAIIHHEFIYACFHPTIEDCVIALEKNYYPLDSELYKLTREGGSYYENLMKHIDQINDPSKIMKIAQLAGVDKKVLTIVTEEGEHHKNEDFPELVHSSHELSFSNSRLQKSSQEIQRTETVQEKIKNQILKKIQKTDTSTQEIRDNQQKKTQEVSGFRPMPNQYLQHKKTVRPKRFESPDKEVKTLSLTSSLNEKNTLKPHETKSKSLQVKEEDDALIELQFQEPIKYSEERLEGTSKKRYGVSIWKINRGQQAFQVDEHPFNFYPVSQRFFISHDQKYIVIFLLNESAKEDYISRIRILNIETLQCVQEINDISDLCIQQNILIDAALIWNSTFLYFQTLQECYFINMETQEIQLQFQLCGTVDGYQTQIKHALFKEKEENIMQVVAYQTKNGQDSGIERFQSMKLSLFDSEEIFDKILEQSSIYKGNMDYIGTIGYNKSLSHIVFPGEQVFYIYYTRTRALKNYRNVQNCQVQKNGFLYDHLWIAYNDDNYDTFATTTQSLLNKYPISDLDLDDFRLGDIQMERTLIENDRRLFAIGKKGENEASSRICINVTKTEENQQPFINYIQETSEYVFLYPMIVYCKGNQELFMQSLHQPERLVKLDLEDYLNQSAKLKPIHLALGNQDGTQTFRKYESIAFLTQNEDQLFFNVLEYRPYGDHRDYTFYKSIQTIQKPKQSFGGIIKAVFQRVKHKECKDNDYILILQYRNQILIRSFFNYFVLNIDKYIFKFPMIYLPSKTPKKPDSIFFISKDGYSTKIEKISFNGKETKDPIFTVQELKTSNIYIFCYHDGCFYLMDDSLTLKQYSYEKRSFKFRYVKSFEFSLEYRDFLMQPVDFNDIQVTSKGVYRGLMFYPFFEQNIFNKDTSMIKTEPILSIPDNDLFAGPKKLSDTKYILYVARGDQRILTNNTHHSLEDINDEDDDDSFKEDNSLEGSLSNDNEIQFTENQNDHNIPIKTPVKTKLAKDDFDVIVDQSKHVENSNSKFNSNNNNTPRANDKNKESLQKSKSLFQNIKDQIISIDSVDGESSDDKSSLKISFSIRKNKQKAKTKSQKNLNNINIDKQQQNQTTTDLATRKSLQIPMIENMITGKESISGIINTEASNHQVNEQVYAWIVPYLDSNVIHLTHNMKENNNPKLQIKFSTFINDQDDILCQMNGVFNLFTKNGSLLYELQTERNGIKEKLYFQKNNLTLENISSSMKFFLFYNSEKEEFEIFQLLRERYDEKSFKASQKTKINRMKTTRSVTTSNLNFQQSYDKHFQPYFFKYIKSVKEMAKQLIQEDYFNQRSISDQGIVFQMIQVRNSANMQTPKNVFEHFKQGEEETQRLHELNSISEFSTDQKVFEFYMDEEVLPEINDKFQLIKDHCSDHTWTSQKEIPFFGYQIINEFLFIRRQTKLEYLKIFQVEPQSQSIIYNIGESKATFIRLMLDRNAEIQRIMSTSQKELVQIIVSDDRFMYVITWDIVNNMEYQMMQIEKKFTFNSGHIICKGVTERHNYIPLAESFYDLYYGLPFKFFKGTTAPTVKHQMNLNERKMSRFNKEYLDQFENNKVFQSYSYLDLCYMRALQNMNIDQCEQHHILVNHLHIRIKGMTVFQYFALDAHILKEISEEILKVDDSENPSSHSDVQFNSNCQKFLFLGIIYPNYYNQNAFDLAMLKKSPKSIEIMLDCFSHIQKFALSKFILHHFAELFQMEILSFQNFLAKCIFQPPRMREVKILKWVHNEDFQYIDYHTSYLGETFYNKIQKKRTAKNILQKSDDDEYTLLTKQRQTDMSDDDEMEKINMIENYNNEITDNSNKPNNNKGSNDLQKQQTQNQNNETFKENKDKMKRFLSQALQDITLEEKTQNMQWNKAQVYNVGEYKRVETYAIEFDWIFRGYNSKKFIEYLATTSNDTIFGIDTIQVAITFLWAKFFYHIRNKIFFPFVVYFLVFFTSATFVYEYRINLLEAKLGQNDKMVWDEERYKKWAIADQVLISIILALCVYFLLIEIRQMISLKCQYFRGFWNLFDLLSIGTNFTYIICDLLDTNPKGNRLLASIAVLFMWLKLLYFLRLFAPTAALIRMVVEIIKDISVFLVVYFIGIIGFANAIFILSYNLSTENFQDFTDGDFSLAIIYSYRQGLGDFNSTFFEENVDKSWWYILFVMHTIFIQIILLNLLIAIMSDSFDKVTEKKEESKLREVCEMMFDYEYVMKRDQEFKYSKYIIVNKVEKAQTNLSQDWEGKITALKNHFQMQITELKRENKVSNENLRDEVIGNSKSLEQKFLDMQQLVMKQSSQVTVMLKKLDKVSDTVDAVNKNTRHLNQEDMIQNIEIEEEDKRDYL